MIHLWKINDTLELELNIEELLKYPLLSKFYKQDTSPAKVLSTKYFRYLDFFTNSNGYCVRNGLNFTDSHKYALRQCKFPKDYNFPTNNKEIIDYVRKELESDNITKAINSCIKTLRISTKTLDSYIDYFNEMADEHYRDKDGNVIDMAAIVSKAIKTMSDIPKTIESYEQLLEKQKANQTELRGTGEFSESMDGDDGIERYLPEQR